MDSALMEAVYGFLSSSKIGYDRFFFDLYGGTLRMEKLLSGNSRQHYVGEAWNALRSLVELYQPTRPNFSSYYDAAGPCTLLIDEIESIWSAIAHGDDWSPFAEKISRIRARGEARSHGV